MHIWFKSKHNYKLQITAAGIQITYIQTLLKTSLYTTLIVVFFGW
jgi:hypothetical protein